VAADGGTPSLGTTARRGFLWQAVAFLTARLTLLASTVVLARMLGPEDYGTISLALVVVLALNVVADLGVSQAIVYLPASTRRTDAALGTALVGSATMALAWVAVAPSVARWLGRPEAATMMQVLALVLVLTSVGQVPDAVLRKQLQFSKRLPGELLRGLGRGVIAIVLALLGFGAWSLVWAEVVGAAAYAVVSWLMLARRPAPLRAWPARDEVRPLLRFGLPTALNGGLNTAVLNVDYLVVAGTLGTTSLGLYFVGFRIPELLVLSVFQIFSQVTYPIYTRVNDDPERLRGALLLSLRVQATYGMAAGAGIVATAPLLVPVVFGEGYAGTVPVMQAIACAAVFKSLSAGAIDVFKAVGRPELGAWLGVARLVVLVPTLLVATQWGIVGVAVAQAVHALVFAVATQRIACAVTHLSSGAVLRTLAPAVVIAAATAAGAYASGLLAGGQSWASLTVVAAAGVLTGAMALRLADRQLIRQVMGR
jgi:PST family polysaccharide transporter